MVAVRRCADTAPAVRDDQHPITAASGADLPLAYRRAEADWAKLIKGWFPDLAYRRLRQVTWAEIDPHRDYVKSLLETTTVTTIHQRLWDEQKLKVSLTAFRRWVHENLPEMTARSKVTVLRDAVGPGSEAQIDYGFLGQWINPSTGKRHRIWAFVMVLPCSRHMFVRSGGPHGPARLDRGPRGGVSLLRRRPAPAGAGQPAHGGGSAGPL
ncbi:hypothetical protein [Streptomyces sp. NPDC046942]|uniref:hypothetical protein n=1 Tax=Streptomyces sp. NPDC046942 TaxID=3155137 RepID=UPI0033F4A661